MSKLMKTTIGRLEAYNRIMESKGKIFKACFEKQDGTNREMLCRIGVTKYVTGTGLKYNPAEHGNVIVFDMKSKGYRTIKVDNLKYLLLGGKAYEVKDTSYIGREKEFEVA